MIGRFIVGGPLARQKNIMVVEEHNCCRGSEEAKREGQGQGLKIPSQGTFPMT